MFIQDVDFEEAHFTLSWPRELFVCLPSFCVERFA